MDEKLPPTALALLMQRVDGLHGDISEMRQAMREVANAVTQLALVEERQTQIGNAMERAFGLIEKVADRVGALEKTQPQQKQVAEWVHRALWAAAAAMLVFVSKKIGLM
ncbi:MAG: hypothetical protein KGL43_04045 [Burkholderiales bacterium]|nr:hypothetical protein [Burkholderiales bacterium]